MIDFEELLCRVLSARTDDVSENQPLRNRVFGHEVWYTDIRFDMERNVRPLIRLHDRQTQWEINRALREQIRPGGSFWC